MSKLVLVSSDLMVASRVEGAARKCGFELVMAGVDAACHTDCRAVLVDLRVPGLDLPNLVEKLRQQSAASIVAFGPHVHEQSLATARAAGCDLVITRGQLERDAEAILAQYGAAE